MRPSHVREEVHRPASGPTFLRPTLPAPGSDLGGGGVKPTGAIATLLARWLAEAETLRRRGAPAQADALDACSRELEAALHQHELEILSVADAALESGYSPSQLRRQFRGRAITRGALPRKPAA